MAIHLKCPYCEIVNRIDEFELCKQFIYCVCGHIIAKEGRELDTRKKPKLVRAANHEPAGEYKQSGVVPISHPD